MLHTLEQDQISLPVALAVYLPFTSRPPVVHSPSTPSPDSSLQSAIATLLRIPLEQAQVFAGDDDGDAVVVLHPHKDAKKPCHHTGTISRENDDTTTGPHDYGHVSSSTHVDEFSRQVDGFSRQGGERFPRILAEELKSKLTELGGAGEILGVVAPDVLRCLVPLMSSQDAPILD